MPTLLSPVTLVANTPVGVQLQANGGGPVKAVQLVNSSASPLTVYFSPQLQGAIPANTTLTFTDLDTMESFGGWLVFLPGASGTCTPTTYSAGDQVPSIAWGLAGNELAAPRFGLSRPGSSADRRNRWVNVKDFGAVGDGVTLDTLPISLAISAATGRGSNAASFVYFPAGKYVTSTQTLYSNVVLVGDGPFATVLQLPSGANADLLSANTANINVNASAATGSNTAISGWGVRDMTLNGNKANQSSGPSYPLRVYGYDFLLQNVVVQQGFTGGILVDWNGSVDPPATGNSMEARLLNVKVHDCNGIGVEWGGPHDSNWQSVVVFKNGSHNFHIGPHSGGILGHACHGWGGTNGTNSVSLLLEGNQCHFANCVFEGSDVVQVACLSDYNSFKGCSIFGLASPAGSHFQVGQASGLTPYNGSAFQSAGLTTAVQVFANDFDSIYTTNPGSNGVFWIPAGGEFGPNRYAGLAWLSGGVLFGVTAPLNGANGTSEVLVAAGGSGGPTPQHQFGGTVAGSQSATAPAVATSGTIATAGLLVSRVSPAGAVTAVVLQAGTVPGQQCQVINEAVSANSITFAVAGTSHVADGASAVIAGLRQMTFVWDSVTSLWYH